MATEPQQLPVTHVEDVEVVLRSVKDDPTHFVCDAAGRLLRLCHSAFNDPERQPSVDRASLQAGGAQAARRSPNDGVVSLVALDIRSAGVHTLNSKGKVIQEHGVDVRHNPLTTNYSHALVVTDPAIASDGAFKRLKEALCLLAGPRGFAYPPASRR